MKTRLNRRSFLQYFGLAASGLMFKESVVGAANGNRPPNILTILVDDLGYGDLSCYGAKDLQSPHIDKLMSQGMRFNEFYANCTVCSPSRAALLTGRYPEFVGIPGVVRTHKKNNWGYLTPDSIMLPELFQDAGYKSILIGKWHLGLRKPNRPNQRGFDLFRGFLGDMMDDYWHHRRHGRNYMRDNEKEIDPEGHATDIFTDWAKEELKQSAESQKPFFMYLAYNAPHFPIQPPPEWLEKVQAREKGISKKRAKAVAFVEHLDHAIGQVLETLDELELSENTIVVFTSDNGGSLPHAQSNGQLRSGKTHMYEGGIKVPTCVRWPGHIRAEQTTDFRALTMDILPTLADMCDVKIDHEIDGRSFKQLLLTGEQEQFEHPVFHMWLQGESKECMRHGDWKLVHDGYGKSFELYNIEKDPYEKRNLAEQEPERFKRMMKILKNHFNNVRKVPWQRPRE